jgi:hypothetical protein
LLRSKERNEQNAGMGTKGNKQANKIDNRPWPVESNLLNLLTPTRGRKESRRK